MARFMSCVDLHLVLRDAQGRVLLGQRQNTGWSDGLYGLPSGHLEEGESALAGVAREAQEETGNWIKPGSPRLVHVMHHRTDSGRIALFFEAADWSGEIVNTEPDKCAGWEFHDPDGLADEVVPYLAAAFAAIHAGEIYSEGGWSSP